MMRIASNSIFMHPFIPNSVKAALSINRRMSHVAQQKLLQATYNQDSARATQRLDVSRFCPPGDFDDNELSELDKEIQEIDKYNMYVSQAKETYSEISESTSQKVGK